MTRPFTTWVEVDIGALTNNVRAIKQLVGPGVLVAPTVKSNAYGHDIALATRAFVNGGADWITVHSIYEARQVRSVDPNIPILIFGYVTREQLPQVLALNCKITLYDLVRINDLEKLAKEMNVIADVHLKIETGIHRQGVYPDEAIDLVKHITAASHLRLEGLSSHFANIEDTNNPAYANKQLEILLTFVRRLKKEGVTIPVCHIANSAATILRPETHLDMVRPGIACYGLWPAEITRRSAVKQGIPITLTPALTWKACVAQIKKVPAGNPVGYGCSYVAPKDIVIAVVPVGYYEGYDRATGPKGYVLIHDKPCKVIGRVCMNNIMVDISKLGQVTAEDEVVLLGRYKDQEITSEEFASWTDRINYEIPTRISTGVDGGIPRIAV